MAAMADDRAYRPAERNGRGRHRDTDCRDGERRRCGDKVGATPSSSARCSMPGDNGRLACDLVVISSKVHVVSPVYADTGQVAKLRLAISSSTYGSGTWKQPRHMNTQSPAPSGIAWSCTMTMPPALVTYRH